MDGIEHLARHERPLQGTPIYNEAKRLADAIGNVRSSLSRLEHSLSEGMRGDNPATLSALVGVTKAGLAEVFKQ